MVCHTWIGLYPSLVSIYNISILSLKKLDIFVKIIHVLITEGHTVFGR